MSSISSPKKLLTILIIATLSPLFQSCISSRQIQRESSFIAVQNVNIVDVLNGSVLYNKSVVIKDSLIYFIGDLFTEKVNPNEKYIDGKGKYLLPGLWDMHFHLCWDSINDSLLFPALIKNGITGLRDMGGDLAIMRIFKEDVKSGKYIGPQIYGAGPMIDGNPPVHRDFSLPVDGNTNMFEILDSLKKNGSDFFKPYSLIKENQLRDISRYCHANNMSFEGHLSEYIEPEISLSLGQKSVEHLNRLDEIWQNSKERIDDIANLMITNKTFLCPTLITYELKTKLRDTSILNPAYNKYISPTLMEEWKSNWASRIKKYSKDSDLRKLDSTFISELALVAHLNKMGVFLLAGSDFAGMPYVYPGVGLQEELALLVKAGLTTQQALKTATINPAIFMSLEKSYGSITVGKMADMVLLEKNPLENIENTRSITSVFLKGKLVTILK